MTTCRDCGAGFTGNQAHCTVCHQTFVSPEAFAAHWVGRRCARPDAVPCLTRRADGVWKLTAIPGQLSLTPTRRRR